MRILQIFLTKTFPLILKISIGLKGMNLVHGHTFDLLARRALYLGASSFCYSSAKNKKYFVVYEGKKINFGDKRYQDFLIHGDSNRRRLYRERASRIRDKNGVISYLNKHSPNYWSYHLLW